MSAGSTTASLPDYNDRPGPLLLLTIALVGVFAFLQVYSVQSILPELRRDLNASVVEIGRAVGATVLAVAIVSPLMGMVSDALGRKALVVASVLALALPTAAMMGVRTVHGLTLWRFVQGLAVPGVTVVAIAYIGEEFRRAAMVRVMTFYITGSVLGGFLGRFLLGHLTDFMSWRAAFGVMAALNLAGTVLVWRVLPPSRHFVADRQVASAFATLGQLLRHPALQAAGALGFTALFAQVGMFTFVNFHLAAAPYFFSPADLANVFAVYLLGVVVTPLAGRWIPRLSARRTILLSVGLSALGVLLTLLPQVPGIVAALALASCGTFITQSATLSFIAYRITHGRSLASGLYYTAYYAGGFCGAWLGGVAYAHGGWPGTVALLLATQVLGWGIAWRFIAAPARA
ncbi:MAG: putative MFS-type transporter [Burkholderiaceae bacterium]|jgi:predicted MFS family arabinose efflux permease|nr:MAG: putative MFS-type transporter [Burkholderiaceae bacterium]